MKDIRNTDEKDARLWNSIRIASIAAVMAGVAIAAYSAYGVATFNPADAFAGTGSVSGAQVFVSGGSGVARQGIAIRIPFLSTETVLVGILIALLGFVTLRYAELKITA